jgi:transposase-like protein
MKRKVVLDEEEALCPECNSNNIVPIVCEICLHKCNGCNYEFDVEQCIDYETFENLDLARYGE